MVQAGRGGGGGEIKKVDTEGGGKEDRYSVGFADARTRRKGQKNLREHFRYRRSTPEHLGNKNGDVKIERKGRGFFPTHWVEGTRGSLNHSLGGKGREPSF